MLKIVHHFILQNAKNNFFILDKGPTDKISDHLRAAERKKIIINFSKTKTRFYLSLHYNIDET